MNKYANRLRYRLIVFCLRVARDLAAAHQRTTDMTNQGRYWRMLGVQSLLADAEGDSGYYKARRGGEPW